MPYFETVEARNAITPQQALEHLREGNARFTHRRQQQRDLISKLAFTKDGQLPYASVLSCMDSRTSVELIFDQGLGDVFSVRIAGNVVSDFVLGSLEYATVIAGTKIIVVLGHTGCGAIAGAIEGVELEHLSALLQRIQPAIEKMRESHKTESKGFADAVAAAHVVLSAKQILKESVSIENLCRQGRLIVVPALYDLATGKVEFYEPVVSSEK